MQMSEYLSEKCFYNEFTKNRCTISEISQKISECLAKFSAGIRTNPQQVFLKYNLHKN